MFVAGSAVYSADDPDAMVAELRCAAAAAASRDGRLTGRGTEVTRARSAARAVA